MRDSQELRLINGLVEKIDTHHGSMGGAISMAVVVIVAWFALKELANLALNLFGRLG